MRNGANSLRIRDHNRQVVLEAIRARGGKSRAEVAARTGLTEQAISKIVKRLLGEGLVVEAGSGEAPFPGRGRPPIRIRVNPDAGYAVGVQVDRDEISAILLDLVGGVRARVKEEAPGGPLETVGRVVRMVEETIEVSGVDRTKILGLGVACPGPLDPVAGIVHEPQGMPGWKEVRLKEWLEERTGFAVAVDNDAVAAAVGERWTGKARGVRSFAFVYLGWGIGAGLFVDGQVYRGATGTAGEIGHIPLDPDGLECECGSRGCLTRYCSPRDVARAVERRLRRGEASSLAVSHEPEGIDFAAVSEAALAGDRLALEEIEGSGRMLGNALLGLTNALDLEMVVLGGKGFGELGDVYMREVRRAFDERLLYRDRRRIALEASEAGEDAGAVGAASLVLHATYASPLSGPGMPSREEPVKQEPFLGHPG